MVAILARVCISLLSVELLTFLSKCSIWCSAFGQTKAAWGGGVDHVYHGLQNILSNIKSIKCDAMSMCCIFMNTFIISKVSLAIREVSFGLQLPKSIHHAMG
jgi:hypothetical protein